MANKSISVTAIRTDGKLNVFYHFPVSGRSIRKIITLDTLRAEALKGYDILNAPTCMAQASGSDVERMPCSYSRNICGSDAM